MKKRISKILGIGMTTGLIFGLVGALFAAPASADLMEWGIVNTPSWEDMVILPQSDILDYDIGGDGDTIFVALELSEECTGVGDMEDFALVKSTDGGVTWTDITANVTGAANIPSQGFRDLQFVSVATDDEDWLAVAGYMEVPDDVPMVVASQDGGDNFSYAGDVIAGSTDLEFMYDLDVSIEVDGIHNIALAGREDDTGYGTIFRLEAGTWLSGSWVDTSSAYLGWDGTVESVMACEFSRNFDMDDTIVCLGVDGTVRGGYPAWGQAILQSGIWEGGSGSWNANAGFPGSTVITADGDTLLTGGYLRSMGLSLPEDYDGSDPGARAVFLYVDAYNDTTDLVGGCVFRADNNTLSKKT